MDKGNGIHQRDPAKAAAAWHAQLEDGASDANRAEFAAWVRKSPAHIAEFLRLSAIRDGLADPHAFDGIDLDELLKDLPRNVHPLGPTERSIHPQSESPVRTPTLSKRIFVLAATVLIAALIGWLSARGSRPPFARLKPASVYTTGIGEQRSILLVDGSIAELNTQSRILVQLDQARRDITLTEGEALFRVAKDARRPFRVLIDATVVQAVGTEFTVRRDATRAVVTVIDGRVTVGKEGESTRLLSPGERLVLPGGDGAVATEPIEHVSPNSATAWIARRLVFDDLPLEAVAAEFNRYNRRQIHIEAPLHDRKVTGVFNANDPDAFVAFLQGRGDLVISNSTDGGLLIRPR